MYGGSDKSNVVNDKPKVVNNTDKSTKKSPINSGPKVPAGKLTDKQKGDLKKHMVKMQKGGMSASEMKSHRMKMMSRVRKGMSIASAHKDIMKN